MNLAQVLKLFDELEKGLAQLREDYNRTQGGLEAMYLLQSRLVADALALPSAEPEPAAADASDQDQTPEEGE